MTAIVTLSLDDPPDIEAVLTAAFRAVYGFDPMKDAPGGWTPRTTNRWMPVLNQLTEQERSDYMAFRKKRYSRPEALTAIGRTDLIGLRPDAT